MMDKIIALDVGGSSVKCALFSKTGTIEDRWGVPTNKGAQNSTLFEDIAKSIKLRNIDLDKIKGIGIGVPGPVVGDTVYGAVNLGLDKTDVKKALEEALGKTVPIYVENDANCAAYGEFFTLDNASSLALLTLGTGIGGGIILNQAIYRGINGSAGEIGHMNTGDEDALTCNCGLSGCLETYASATGIKRHFLRARNQGIKTKLNQSEINAKMIFDAAKAGDSLALKIIDKAAYHLAKGIANMNVILDLDVVLVGGGLSLSGAFFTEKIKTYFQDLAFTPLKGLEIKTANLGNDAGIYGAYQVVKHA